MPGRTSRPARVAFAHAWLAAMSVTSACGGDPPAWTWETAGDAGDTGSQSADGTATLGSGTSETSAGSADPDDSGGTGGAVFDVPPGNTGDTDGMPTCHVADDMDAVAPCTDHAPPDSFEPDVQWTFGDGMGSMVTPLVANFTDDDGDGDVDLCDVPDVLVVAQGGTMYLLDGASGALHFTFSAPVAQYVTPAIGDIDGDGFVEVVTAEWGEAFDSDERILAFENDGTVKWTSDMYWDGLQAMDGALAIADLDNDGEPEILAGNLVLDADGGVQVSLPDLPPPMLGFRPSAVTAADLDDDGDLEVVMGHSAWHHDGTPHYQQESLTSYGYPQVADLDDDPEPEVLIATQEGIALLEHDGTIIYQQMRPTGDPVVHTNWLRPATIHDFDGDHVSEFAQSSAEHYAVYDGDASLVWSSAVADASGAAASTAFDFLGDGSAEAMYADEGMFWIFDGTTGAALLQVPRYSATIIEFPTVADVDNDGSAEIVVVSQSFVNGAPMVQVVRDVMDRWIPARRIWNQHTYHVTNVREDGTIPQFEPPHWQLLNTFRTQSQIEGGGVCDPRPEG